MFDAASHCSAKVKKKENKILCDSQVLQDNLLKETADTLSDPQ